MNHRKKHQNHKIMNKFGCEHCGKLFPSNSNLKVHILTHTGEKPYNNCHVCNKGFTKSSNLKVHETIHSGETSFKWYFKETFSSKLMMKLLSYFILSNWPLFSFALLHRIYAVWLLDTIVVLCVGTSHIHITKSFLTSILCPIQIFFNGRTLLFLKLVKY